MRKLARHRNLVLPSLLLIASGTAFGGMAVLPSLTADATPLVTAAAVTAPVELTAPATQNVELMGALSKGLAVANKPKPKPAAAPAPRASRDRQPAASGSLTDGVKYVRPGLGQRTSGYGYRWGRLHAGIDLAAGTGSPIRAVAAGTVQSAGTEGGYGRAVRITHADGTVTLYGHMSALLVSDGEKVSAGEQIGREGSTGHSTGPHLHFEVHINDEPVNPLPWLRKRGIDV